MCVCDIDCFDIDDGGVFLDRSPQQMATKREVHPGRRVAYGFCHVFWIVAGRRRLVKERTDVGGGFGCFFSFRCEFVSRLKITKLC